MLMWVPFIHANGKLINTLERELLGCTVALAPKKVKKVG